MRNYSISEEIIKNILSYKKYKILIYENIQKNNNFLRVNKNKKKYKEIINNSNKTFIPETQLNYNLILPKNNNFRQNPEYSFFKTKRESFRKENIFLCLKILGIEINEKDIYEENNKIENIPLISNFIKCSNSNQLEETTQIKEIEDENKSKSKIIIFLSRMWKRKFK